MVTHPPAIEIREIKEISELRTVEYLQQEVWGCSDREVLPSISLIPLLEIGGVLLGAFDEDQLIGFVLGFPGIEDGRVFLHSDMLAVKRDYRSRGLGYKLKLAQRERALAKGIYRITWTFDPLQSLNAYLNFSKLGVIANRYQINYYGDTSSFLHSTGTDRLWVTWELNSERVKHRLEQAPTQQQVPVPADRRTLVHVDENNAPIFGTYPNSERSVIEIPGGIDSLAETDPALARRWRESTRAAFTGAIDAGMTVEEFIRIEREGRPVGVYLLEARPCSDEP